MIGMLIVDDEIIIRNGIKNIADWKSHGIELVGAAFDGVEGLSIFLEKRPRIVITDIKMPNKNGVDFIREIRKVDSEAKIVVLSGYDDYRYLKEALVHNVNDYILKPVVPKEFVEIICRIRDDYLEDEKKRQNEKTVWQQIKKSKPIISERFFFDLSKGIEMNQKIIADKLGFLDLDLDIMGEYSVLIVNIDDFEQLTAEFAEMNRQMVHFLASNEIRDCGISWTLGMGEFGVLVTLKNESALDLAKRIRERLQACGFSSTICIGKSCRCLKNISSSLKDAKDALKYRLILGNDQIILSDEIVPDVKEYDPHWEEEICLAIRSADVVKTKNILDLFFENYVRKNSPENVRLMSMKLVFSASMELTSIGSNPDEIIGDWLSLCARLQNSKTYEQLRKSLTETLVSAVEKLVLKHCNNIGSTVEKIKKYLEDHLDENLSLKKISDHVYLSPNYVCILFKRQTSQNISDYLTTLRIEKAKKLLKESQYKMYEISNMVGYEDSRYFGSLFRKHTGMKLSEYRARCI